MSFASLGLSQDLLEAVRYAGYETPTAVQEKAIPFILKGEDLIVEAKTGTGKTASFALPILQLLQNPIYGNKRVIKALILTPTRELAMQVEGVLKAYGRQLTNPLRAITLTGGSNIDLQIRNLRHGADMAVATPGRLLDLIKRGDADFSRLEILVIDEADKMFDLGFAEELGAVLNALPLNRQNLLFSATIPEKVTILVQKYMRAHAPLRIKADENVPTPELIKQRTIEVNRNNRGPLLRYLIQTEKWDHVLIFVASVRAANTLSEKLNKANIKTESFHGGLTQAQRGSVLGRFKNKSVNVLVATDLAARGIDIDKLPYVVNYDLPRSPDDYIHRIGRTARAGEAGTAITFIGHEDQHHFSLIEKRLRMNLKRESVADFGLTGEPLPKVKGKPPVKGSRMSKKDKARAAAGMQPDKKEGS